MSWLFLFIIWLVWLRVKWVFVSPKPKPPVTVWKTMGGDFVFTAISGFILVLIATLLGIT